MVSEHILGSGLHYSYSLRVAARVNIECSSFVLSVRSRRVNPVSDKLKIKDRKQLHTSHV